MCWIRSPRPCSTADQCGANAVCVQAHCKPRQPRKILFSDDFSDSTFAKWTAFGSPAPAWVALFGGHTGVFDNRGDGMHNRGAVSKATVACPDGCSVEAEVYAGFGNLAGCWSMSSIGLASSAYPDGKGWSEE